MVVQTVERPKGPKSNLAAIAFFAFNSSFVNVYPRPKPS
jgi:dTDP-glucose pyrophosphorylase